MMTFWGYRPSFTCSEHQFNIVTIACITHIFLIVFCYNHGILLSRMTTGENCKYYPRKLVMDIGAAYDSVYIILYYFQTGKGPPKTCIY